jgi:hypothetical protein
MFYHPLRKHTNNSQQKPAITQGMQALDTVWFMSGSLFNKYPYDVPTEAFSFTIFRQAFAAVQAAVVHLRQEVRMPPRRSC